MSSESFHLPNVDCDCVFGGALVGSSGRIDAPIVIIGEAPIYQDRVAGAPFSGPAGNLLKQNISDGDMQNILFMNAVDCVPINATRDKYMEKAIECCRSSVLAKLSMYPRKAIICLGNSAVRSVMGDHSLKITQVRGVRYKSPLAEYGVFPLIHPIALARGTGSYRQWQQDLAAVFDIVQNHGKDSRQYIPYKRYDVFMPVEQAEVDALFEGATEATCDIETTGFDFRHDRILQIGITIDNPRKDVGHVFYPGTFHLLKKHLGNRNISWCYQNGKFDVKFLRTYGIDAKVDDDTMLMSYALDEQGGIHDLDTLGADVLAAPVHKDVLKPYLKKKGSTFEDVPPDVLATYLVDDIGKTSQVRHVYGQRVRRDKALKKLYEDLLIPASDYLAWVETNGIYADRQQIADNQAFYESEQEESAQIICARAGIQINPGSPQQVAKLLFDVMRFPNRWKGSTSVDVLDKLKGLCRDKGQQEIIAALMRYRTAAKMNGTYCRGWLKHIHTDDGRIHTTYKIHGTRTGRLSSAEPNVQNIPRLTRIRGQVIAGPGMQLVECDFSQAELRLLAALSGDPLLCEIFNTGGDPHSDLAEFLFPGWYERQQRAEDTGNPVLKAECKEQRTKCKNVNFGIIYGITEFGLAEQIQDTVAVAKRMLAGWYERYHVAAAFIRGCRATVIRNQVMTTCFGRKKRNGVVSRMNLAALENEAANFPEQSIASDFTLMAGVRIWARMRDMQCAIVNTVHDSIIFEAPLDGVILRPAVKLVTSTMQSLPRDYNITAVPFLADAEVGHRWGALEKYHGHEHEGIPT